MRAIPDWRFWLAAAGPLCLAMEVVTTTSRRFWTMCQKTTKSHKPRCLARCSVFSRWMELKRRSAWQTAQQYGLAAAIYTQDVSCALRLARDIKAGQVFINEYHSAGDTVPFGGFKRSGIGREKGLAAIANYTELKSITARVEW